MDIIAAHQQGLIEQLEAEVAALAGRGRDHGQRAVVLHHLYDHARGEHHWALAEAHRGLRIARGLARLERRLGRWGWKAAARAEARAALEALAEALGEAARERCTIAYRAYRLSATKALRGEAERVVALALLAALDHCHVARRGGVAMTDAERRTLTEASGAAATFDSKDLADAWAAIDATRLGAAVRRLLGDRAMGRDALAAARHGCDRAEARLRQDKSLPEKFRTNPAQHFYALQHALAERRRKQWREDADRDSDGEALAA